MNDIRSIITTVASVATAIGVVLAWLQIALMKRHEKDGYEHSFCEQYRSLIRELPIELMSLEDRNVGDVRRCASTFYAYFDLCNEQIRLHRNGSIGRVSWKEWEEGIMENFLKLSFKEAWRYVATFDDKVFDELRFFLSQHRETKELVVGEMGKETA